MNMRQITCTQGHKILTTWVNDVPKLATGVELELKGMDGRWIIAQVYDTVVDSAQLNKQRGFDNNNYDKHKGLGL